MFGRSKKAAGGQKQVNQPKLHSIAGLLRERSFTGSFEAGGASYSFVYAPSRAEITGRRLQLTGRLSVTNARGETRTKDNLRALLVSTQGGVGAAPIRQQIMVGGVAASTAATSGQQQQQAGGAAGNDPRKPGEAARARPLPDIEATGPLSFCGAMYFRLDAVDGSAVAVPADLSRVQLNARLAPADDAGRALHGIYSTIVDALYARRVDTRLAAAAIAELNKMLAASSR
jgi:hypothetical protein